MSLQQISAVISEALKGVKRTSAMQTIGWLCAIITLPSFYFASKDTKLSVQFFYVGCAPISLFIVAYIYFMFRDPDRLHSEEFQLRSRSLDIVETKAGGVKVDSVDITAIANPYPSPKRIEDRTVSK